MSRLEIHHSNALSLMDQIPYESIDLIYIDPPFNTGKTRVGRVDKKRVLYLDRWPSVTSYIGWLKDHLKMAFDLLTPNGSMFVHVDQRVAAEVKLSLDFTFYGHHGFVNWITWNYNSGGASKRRFAAKHDDIFWYAKSDQYTFNVLREPYPRSYGDRKGFHPDGRIMNDWWQIPILSTTSTARTGYPTQKPVALLERIISAASNEGDRVLDFFAGSGTTGEACKSLNRYCILVDANEDAIKVMKERLQ